VQLFGVWGIAGGPLGLILVRESFRSLYGGQREGGEDKAS
jgi:hypothetical protein